MKRFLALPLLCGAAVVISGCRKSSPPSSPTQSGANIAAAPSATATSKPDDRPETRATKISFEAYAKPPKAGAPDVWTIKVADVKSAAAIDGFDVARGRLMHVVVVKQDLSWFNRLNPSYSDGGIFTVNSTLPRAGRYKVFTDYVPSQGGHESAQFQTSIPGLQAKAPALIPDIARGGWMIKPTVAYPESEPDKKGGQKYQVALKPGQPRAQQESALIFQVRDAAGKPIKDLELYLGAMGQCSVFSADASQYVPLHAEQSKPGSDVAFRVRFPAPGLYKMWGQFLRRGQVISAPFVLRVGAAKAAAKAASTSSTS